MYKIAFLFLMVLMLTIVSVAIKSKCTGLQADGPVMVGSPILVSIN